MYVIDVGDVVDVDGFQGFCSYPAVMKFFAMRNNCCNHYSQDGRHYDRERGGCLSVGGQDVVFRS